MDKYSFGKPNPDGSRPLKKNDNLTICVKAPVYAEQNKFDQSKIELKRMACVDFCPFMQTAARKKKNEEELIPGIVLSCQDKPIFFPIESEVKLKVK